MTEDKTQRFYMLDLFRFIAAVAVLLSHTNTGRGYPGIPHAYLAVDFFFVLSGFILTWVYFDKTFSYPAFVGNRIARLWPLNIVTFLYAAYMATAHTMVLPNPDISSKTFFLNLFLLQGTGLGAEGSYDIPSWTVSAEFWVNILFPLFFRRWWWLATLVSAGVYYWLIKTYGHLDVWGPQLPEHGGTGSAMLRCFAGFSFGVATYYFYKISLRLQMRRAVEIGLYSLLEILAVALVLIFFAYGAERAQDDYFVVPVFMLVVYVFARQSGVVSLALRPLSPVAVLLGAISYGVYLWHVPIANTPGMRIDGTDMLLRYVGIVVGVALVTHYYVELPVQRTWKRLIRPKTKA